MNTVIWQTELIEIQFVVLHYNTSLEVKDHCPGPYHRIMSLWLRACRDLQGMSFRDSSAAELCHR